MKLATIFYICCCVGFSQQKVDDLIEDVLNGSKDSAIVYLPLIEQQYPYNPNMLFLKGLMEINGEEAMQIFVELYNNHPSSKYGDDAVMKIAEYYYASGLYIQAAEWLKKMPVFYSRSEHIERAVKLFLNSLIVSGHKDTAIFYSKIFQKQFPTINIDEKIGILLSDYKDSNNKKIKNDKLNSISANNKSSIPMETKKINIIEEKNTKKFSLQSGAFGNKKNAEKQKNILKNGGFDARINKISKNKKNLFIVRISYFHSRSSAEKMQKKIKSTLAIDSIIILNR